MQIKPKDNCPLNGFQPCRQLDCAWFVKITGEHPQTGDVVAEEWGCAMAWMPLLLINGAKAASGAGKETEALRKLFEQVIPPPSSAPRSLTPPVIAKTKAGDA